MAKSNKNKNKKPGKPPKIKLSSSQGNGLPQPASPGGTGKETARIDLSEAKTDLSGAKTDLESARSDLNTSPPDDTTRINLPKPPPKLKPVKGKQDTAKLDLASAASAGDKDDTSRIDLPTKKSETARISLSDARPLDESGTTKPDQYAETQPIAPAPGGKADTYRIDIEDAKPVPEAGSADGDFSPATSGIGQISEADRERIMKQSTMRVDLSETEEVTDEAASRNQTMRVELDDKAPLAREETARVQVPGTGSDSTPPIGTTRVQMDAEPSTDDVFKRRGPAAGAPAGPDAAAASTPPPEPVATPDIAPSSETARVSPPLDAAKSKTARVSPPLEAAKSKTARVSPPQEAEKSKTARIEVPAELAAPGAGRPKTIRIKRADSTAGPLQAPVPEPSIKRGSKGKGKKGKRPTIVTDEVGTLYSVLALVSLIVMGVVVYVLLAQTLDPSLPWIGKISL